MRKWSILTASLLTLLLALTLPTVHAQTRPAPAPTTQRRPTSVPLNVEWLRDLEFAKVGPTKLQLDLYLPEKKYARPVPLIVYIHGGGFIEGDKFPCEASWLSARGFAVAAINYRLSTTAQFPAQIFDCKAAVRWLRAHAKEYEFDAKHVGAYGESAGGHLVAMLGTTGGNKDLEGDIGGNLTESSSVQAVLDQYGPTDFTHQESLLVARNESSRQLMVYIIEQLLGTKMDDAHFLERAQAASPVHYVSKDAPPFLIFHGEKDALVSPQQSEILDAALKKEKVPSTLLMIKGAGHGLRLDPKRKLTIQKFFDKNLRPDPTATAPGK